MNEAQSLLLTAAVAAVAMVIGAVFDFTPVDAAIVGATVVIAVLAGVVHALGDNPNEDKDL